MLVGGYGTYGGLGGYGSLVTYGSLNLTDLSPAQVFVEPLSLVEVQAYLKVPVRSPIDSDENALLSMFITAAREQAEIMQGRDLVRKQWDLSLDYWSAYVLPLRAPLVSVDLMQYRDSNGAYTTMVNGADFIVDAAKGPGLVAPMFNKTWPTFAPWPSSAILIRFTSGYSATSPFWSDAGARLKTGMKMLISAWYNNRLPFEKGVGAMSEYPYAVTACLGQGAVSRVR